MKYDQLLLKNQLCFPLYASSKKIIGSYREHLDKINLTYTQYVAMMVLWEYKKMYLKELGEHLLLDSGTLTPLLKRLEKKMYITRAKDTHDERKTFVEVTDEGFRLQEKAKDIPSKIAASFNLDAEETTSLYKILYKIINN